MTGPMDGGLNLGTTLEPVTCVRPVLKLDLWGLPGAASLPFLAGCALKQLEQAARLVAKHRGDGALELVLWDAHRSRVTQAHLFELELDRLRAEHPNASEPQLKTMAEEVVEDPDGVFSFGTGGAVAVTLACDGAILDLGSAFGERGESAHMDFFRWRPPESQSERDAERYRTLLREAMEDADFVRSEREWWHYEFGTALWARERGRDPLLDEVVPPRWVEGPATRPPVVPVRYSTLHSGVSTPFLGVGEIHDAFAASPRGYYYARASHPGADALAAHLTREIFDGDGTELCVSGLAAALHAVRALMPDDGVLLHARDCYHDCKREFRREEQQRGWTIKQVADPLDALNEDGRVDVVYVDSPSNWRLWTHDLSLLAAAVHKAKARLVVDVTLQPCQPALGRGVDVVVCSLSKDVSLGHTIAGAVASRDCSVLARVAGMTLAAGELTTAETAHTVYQHALSLRDRLGWMALKVDEVADALKGHPAVERVHLADRDLCGGLRGSQLSFGLCNPAQGMRFEQVVGHRALDPRAVLSLASTFGAPFTTVEHFASRLGGLCPDATGNLAIPANLVRIGLGCESGERIARELVFALNASAEHETHAAGDRRLSESGRA